MCRKKDSASLYHITTTEGLHDWIAQNQQRRPADLEDGVNSQGLSSPRGTKRQQDIVQALTRLWVRLVQEAAPDHWVRLCICGK